MSDPSDMNDDLNMLCAVAMRHVQPFDYGDGITDPEIVVAREAVTDILRMFDGIFTERAPLSDSDAQLSRFVSLAVSRVLK